MPASRRRCTEGRVDRRWTTATALALPRQVPAPDRAGQRLRDRFDQYPRDQFLRINNARPLPRGLVTELLPTISSPLPPRLALRRTPSALCDLLNADEHSPFQGLIDGVTDRRVELRRQAVVTDTSIVKMLEESLTSPSGCLFPFRNMTSGETDFAGAAQVLLIYWGAVQATFPDAWGKSPAQSDFCAAPAFEQWDA